MMLSYMMSKHPGQWRPGSIAVINEATGQAVYQAPNVEFVPSLMHELIDDLCEQNGSPFIVRAAMAHLNLTMIHPFSDGNGRMARALQTLVMARDGAPNPIFSSIEEWLGHNRQAYYDVLSAVGQGKWQPKRSALPWVRFCLRAHYQQMTTIIRRDDEMRRVWEEVSRLVQKRSLPERCELPLVDAAYGLRINRPRYMTGADVTEFVASRDLKLLSDTEILVPQGEKRGRIYIASAQLKHIRDAVRDNNLVPDPYLLVGNKRSIAQVALPGMR